MAHFMNWSNGKCDQNQSKGWGLYFNWTKKLFFFFKWFTQHSFQEWLYWNYNGPSLFIYQDFWRATVFKKTINPSLFPIINFSFWSSFLFIKNVNCLPVLCFPDSVRSQDFKHEVNFLVKLRPPNMVQFLGAVTEKKPLMLITEYLWGVYKCFFFFKKRVRIIEL